MYGHISSGILRHNCHYCNKYTICTYFFCGSWWLLPDLPNLKQHYSWWHIMGDFLLASRINTHQNHFYCICNPFQCGHFFHTHDKSHLTWYIILRQCPFHSHCGFLNLLSSNTCWSTVQLSWCKTLVEKGCSWGSSLSQAESHCIKSTGLGYLRVCSCTRDS